MEKIQYKDLGLMEYKQVWDFQEKLFNEIINLKISNRDLEDSDKIHTPNYLLLCEHPHVFTLGRSGSENNLLASQIQLKAKNAQFYYTNRGGDITYHGPEQIVLYPILDLDNFFTDIGKYIRLLEETIILTIAGYGLTGDRLKGAAGVWLDPGTPKARKICAIGVRTSRWVTMHGLAFNVNTDLSYFKLINPCGFVDKGATSLEQELGRKIDLNEVKTKVIENFLVLFDAELVVLKEEFEVID